MKIIGTATSLIEFPGNLSYVIFTAGCNFKCQFCYVPHLVLAEKYEKEKGISENKILEEIEKRKKFIDAVCITGGEPTIHPELVNLLKSIKNISKNLKIRLETNGSNPKLIEQLSREKLIDSIAVDIKNSREKYSETSGVKVNLKDISRTIKIIKNSDLDYEFRTTLVPGLHKQEDIEKIADWLNEDRKKTKLYLLQQFRSDLPKEKILNQEFMKKGNFPCSELKIIQENLQESNLFEKVEIRGKEI